MKPVHEDDKAFHFNEKYLFFGAYITYKGYSASHSSSNQDFIFFGTEPIISIMQKTPVLNQLTRLTQASDLIISPAFFMLPYFMASLCGQFELARSAEITKFDNIWLSLFFDPLYTTDAKHENTLYDFFKTNELLTIKDITEMKNSKEEFDFNDDLRKKIKQDLKTLSSD